MNIAFFHIGIDTSRPEMLCRSARKIFQGEEVKLVQLTDYETPKVKSADQTLRIRGIYKQDLMKDRMISYREYLKTFQEPTVFLHTDMLITNRFSLNLSRGPILCRREYELNKILNTNIVANGEILKLPEYSMKKLGEIFPYLGCFIADKNEVFLNEVLKIYENLDARHKFWLGDQFALKEAAASANQFSTLGEKFIACNPLEYLEAKDQAAIIYFKGVKLKQLMKDFFIENYTRRNAIIPNS